MPCSAGDPRRVREDSIVLEDVRMMEGEEGYVINSIWKEPGEGGSGVPLSFSEAPPSHYHIPFSPSRLMLHDEFAYHLWSYYFEVKRALLVFFGDVP